MCTVQSTVDSLTEAFAALNQERASLQDMNDRLHSHNVALQKEVEELRESHEHISASNDRLEQLGLERERRLERYASALSLRRDAIDEPIAQRKVGAACQGQKMTLQGHSQAVRRQGLKFG